MSDENKSPGCFNFCRIPLTHKQSQQVAVAQIYKPDGLFVVHESLLEFSLLLQDTGQVRVSCGKLWEHLMKNKKGLVRRSVQECNAHIYSNHDGLVKQTYAGKYQEQKKLTPISPLVLSCRAELPPQCCPAHA